MSITAPAALEGPPLTVAIVVIRHRDPLTATTPLANGHLLTALRQRLAGSERRGGADGIDVLHLDALPGAAAGIDADDASMSRLMDRVREAIGRPAESSTGGERTVVRGGLAPWQVRRVERRMAEGLGETVGLPELAASVGLSPSHFCRAFKAAMGVSPHRYLIGLRVERARQLLAESRMPVIDVGAAVGYDDPSYFARLFRRATGLSPAGYRRRVMVEGPHAAAG
jgi:AraC family transcriptional regulator